jgi:hypothetical protein
MMLVPEKLRWGLPEESTPGHPYRATLIVYGAFALVIVGFAWVTGGDVGEAAIVAGFVFVAATLWSSVRWRQRLRREQRRYPDADADP